MIQQERELEVADNTGAKRVRCFKVLKGSKRRYAESAMSSFALLKKQIQRAVLKKAMCESCDCTDKKLYSTSRRILLRFYDNSCVHYR